MGEKQFQYISIIISFLLQINKLNRHTIYPMKRVRVSHVFKTVEMTQSQVWYKHLYKQLIVI